MKIGTITLHLPFNYGNALQMLSLHRYLLEQGYDAEVLSHWFLENREEITYWHRRIRSAAGMLRFLLNALTFNGVVCQFCREAKLMKWLNEKIRWSQEAGATGEFNPERLPHDIVIAGSDQIWNPKYATSDFFLLPDFPDRIKKIAYAASFGTDCFIEHRIPFFKKMMTKFAAISLRESSAVDIVTKMFALPATLVCDPTLLHTKEEWCRLLGFEMPKKCNLDLVAYFVTPDYRSEWREMIRLARESGRKIHCYAFIWSSWLEAFSFRHPITTLKQLIKRIGLRMWLFLNGVRLHFSATPSEFVERIAKSNGLITDSFHGMMFATIFGKRCNVVIGTHEERIQMSARLRNFTQDFGCSAILTPKADLSAMRELSITPALQALIENSKCWLKAVIEG